MMLVQRIFEGLHMCNSTQGEESVSHCDIGFDLQAVRKDKPFVPVLLERCRAPRRFERREHAFYS